MGEMPILSGMLFCADCGAKLYQVRAEGRTHKQEQKDLSARVIVLRETLAKARTQRLNIDYFLAQVKKYTEVKEPDAEIIRALAERINVFMPSIGTSSEQSNCPKNRKNRHSRISPNYADIFPRNKIFFYRLGGRCNDTDRFFTAIFLFPSRGNNGRGYRCSSYLPSKAHLRRICSFRQDVRCPLQ